jgi:hypothetical protein
MRIVMGFRSSCLYGSAVDGKIRSVPAAIHDIRPWTPAGLANRQTEGCVTMRRLLFAMLIALLPATGFAQTAAPMPAPTEPVAAAKGNTTSTVVLAAATGLVGGMVLYELLPRNLARAPAALAVVAGRSAWSGLRTAGQYALNGARTAYAAAYTAIAGAPPVVAVAVPAAAL